MGVEVLVQIDRLVQLLETPIFTYLRLQLLQPARYPDLIRCAACCSACAVLFMSDPKYRELLFVLYLCRHTLDTMPSSPVHPKTYPQEPLTSDSY